MAGKIQCLILLLTLTNWKLCEVKDRSGWRILIMQRTDTSKVQIISKVKFLNHMLKYNTTAFLKERP